MEQFLTVYRPPMEHDSLIVQVTQGCAHNKCTFCTMYKDRKFKIHDTDLVIDYLHQARKRFSCVKKVFLADGDALVLRTEQLVKVLDSIGEIFPECEHVASYARFTDVVRKIPEELKLLREKGLVKLYMGLESGCDEVLEMVHKNSSSASALEAIGRLKEADIASYLTVLLGVGGKALSEKHVRQTAEIINKTNPEFIGILTLVVGQDSEMSALMSQGVFEMLSPEALVREAYDLICRLELVGTEVRMNHVSNFVNIIGHFPKDKERVLAEIESVMASDLAVRDRYRTF